MSLFFPEKIESALTHRPTTPDRIFVLSFEWRKSMENNIFLELLLLNKMTSLPKGGFAKSGKISADLN
jgi:hypothetical protein